MRALLLLSLCLAFSGLVQPGELHPHDSRLPIYEAQWRSDSIHIDGILLFGFRQYRDSGSRGMDTSLRFRSGDPLNTVCTAFELELAVGILPLNHGDDLFFSLGGSGGIAAGHAALFKIFDDFFGSQYGRYAFCLQ